MIYYPSISTIINKALELEYFSNVCLEKLNSNDPNNNAWAYAYHAAQAANSLFKHMQNFKESIS